MNQHPEVITATIAAFTSAGVLDKEAYANNLRYIEPYVDGVLAAGTTAEFPSLSPEERTNLITWSLEIFGQNRTIAQIGAPSTFQALRLAEMASRSGATRFAAITPYYLTATQSSILAYYAALRDRIDGSLYAYIYPDVANNDVTVATIAKLESLGIDGVKLSGRASSRVAEYRSAAPSIRIWSGNDATLPQTIKAGGTGVVSGVSGVIPTAWYRLSQALEKGRTQDSVQAQQWVIRLVDLLGPSISRLKFALRYLGMHVGSCRMPIDEPDVITQQEITTLLCEYQSLCEPR